MGELMRFLIPLPIPASVYGLALMFAALYFRIIHVEQVREASDFLIDLMPLMFVTPAIAILAYYDAIRPIIFQYTAAVCISTIIVLGVSGVATQFVIRLRKRGQR